MTGVEALIAEMDVPELENFELLVYLNENETHSFFRYPGCIVIIGIAVVHPIRIRFFDFPDASFWYRIYYYRTTVARYY